MQAPLTRTQAEYATRINRVLDHIDRHLDEALDLPALAALACFSPFHFHRVFAAWMGESLGDYLRRRRLEVAATQLWTQPEAGVLEVALRVGFGSGEAFARAFKRQFHCTPSQWQLRRMRNSDQVDGKHDQATGLHLADHGGAINSMDWNPPMSQHLHAIEIQQRPAARIAYLRHFGPYGAEVGRFWGERFMPFMQAHGLATRTRYGIGHDDPSVTAPEQCRYDACVEVDAEFRPNPDAPCDRGICLTELPAGRYLVARFEGQSEQMGEAWQSLYRHVLPERGLIPGESTCYEHYWPEARYEPSTGWFECDICIPLA